MDVVVGRVAKAHGLRGQVVVEVRTDEPDRRFAVGASLSTDHGRALTVSGLTWHSSRLLVSFAGIGDRDAAEKLRGHVLHVDIDPEDTPGDPEEFYDHQLVGLTVTTTEGAHVGTVTSVLHLPAQDTLAIDADGGEVLVPFVTELVPTVDLAGGRLVVADRPGLLGGEADS